MRVIASCATHKSASQRTSSAHGAPSGGAQPPRTAAGHRSSVHSRRRRQSSSLGAAAASGAGGGGGSWSGRFGGGGGGGGKSGGSGGGGFFRLSPISLLVLAGTYSVEHVLGRKDEGRTSGEQQHDHGRVGNLLSAVTAEQLAAARPRRVALFVEPSPFTCACPANDIPTACAQLPATAFSSAQRLTRANCAPPRSPSPRAWLSAQTCPGTTRGSGTQSHRWWRRAWTFCA